MSNVHDLAKYRKKKENERRKRRKELERWRRLGRYHYEGKQGTYFQSNWRPLVALFFIIIIIVLVMSIIY